MARPLSRRGRLTRNISNTGTNSSKQGITRAADGTGTLVAVMTEAEARKNPMGSDPKSPMKILAGLKLNKKNPATETIKRMDNVLIGELNPDRNAMPAKPTMATPPARPSMLSMILKALEIITIQNTVEIQFTLKLGVIGLIMPEETVHAATRTSAKSLGFGPSPFISSINPSNARATVDSRSIRYW